MRTTALLFERWATQDRLTAAASTDDLTGLANRRAFYEALDLERRSSAVLFVDDVINAPVQEVGTALTRHPCFPEGANIGFCQVVDGGFVRLRVFERGVGETRACGTGACAAVIAARLHHRVNDTVKVSLPGGKVHIAWQGPGGAVTMTGPATLVYEGTIVL